MKWSDIRASFPDQWLLVEATTAHTEGAQRIVEDLSVVDAYDSGRSAMDGYLTLHRKAPQRELYVLHTDRERLEIEELRWLGIRGA